MKKILSLVLACMMLIPVLACFGSFASEAPAVEIAQKNVWVGETLYPMFTVNATEGYDVVVKTTVKGETYTCYEMALDEVGTAYVAPYGVAAWDLNAEFVTVPYLYDGDELVATGEAFTYSVLQYLFERLYGDKVTGAEKASHEALIAYATAADTFYNEGSNEINTYFYVSVDGVEGVYQNGAEITLSTDKTAGEGMKFAFEVADVNGNVKATVENGEVYTVEDYHAIITSVEVEEDAVSEGTLAEFKLGADGSASHYDGTDESTYTETVNGYTLNIVSGTKMYTGARDAKGNSCLKFGTGTSSAVGSMSFTVPSNVTKVYIEVAKYKAKTTKVTINGTTYTLTNSSDNGVYDVIEIDTSTTKQVTFTTVAGSQRCMMNSITFYGAQQ